MVKKILLFRHSKPAFPGGKRVCLGIRTDVGICEEGAEKARRAGSLLEREIQEAGAIYTSPLLRARETAEALSLGNVPVVPDAGLIEMDAGEWDGLDFQTIRERYPELYKKRENDLSLAPPGGDEFADTAIRMSGALKRLCMNTEKQLIAAVAHSGVNRAFLCTLTGTPFANNRAIPQEYTSVNIIFYDPENDRFRCEEAGRECP